MSKVMKAFTLFLTLSTFIYMYIFFYFDVRIFEEANNAKDSLLLYRSKMQQPSIKNRFNFDFQSRLISKKTFFVIKKDALN